MTWCMFLFSESDRVVILTSLICREGNNRATQAETPRGESKSEGQKEGRGDHCGWGIVDKGEAREASIQRVSLDLDKPFDLPQFRYPHFSLRIRSLYS